MSKLLALDQSSRITGYAIFENTKLIHYGKFNVENDDFGERLMIIRNKVNDLIIQYNIDEVVFEDIQLQNNVVNNVDTFKKLSEVYGVISELLTELKIKYSTVLASSWKSTLSIKGKDRSAQKKNAQVVIEKTFNIKPTQDECDAICIGLHHINKPIVSDDAFNWTD